MLIKHLSSPTNFCLPVTYSKDGCYFKVNWFYPDEVTLFKAYRQLKYAKCCFKPLYPIVYENEKDEEK